MKRLLMAAVVVGSVGVLAGVAVLVPCAEASDKTEKAMPAKGLDGQAKAPCDKTSKVPQVELKGACWV